MQAINQFQALLCPLLQESPCPIVDVGASSLYENRWKPWRPFSLFYTFDPNLQVKQSSDTHNKNFTFGLWSYRCTQPIHLAAHPPASSLFKPNHDFLNSFQQAELLEAVGTRMIELHTLDQALAHKPVAFMHLDAEGAELEILKGAKNTLNATLGLETKILFNPIRRYAPTFSEIDPLLRSYDLELFHLKNEHWLRKNKIAAYSSSPQLIWGNALYFRSKRSLIKLIQEHPQPDLLLAHSLMLLFVYHLYDYAYEICEALPYESAQIFKKSIRALASPKTPFFKLLGSLALGACKYTLSLTTATKQHRLNYLRRKLRALGKSSLFLGRHDTVFYD